MSLDLLLTPNPWLGPFYMETLYLNNIDTVNFNGTLNIGVAKVGSLGRINIGATGVPVYIDGVLYNPAVGGGYSVVAPISAIDNNGIIIDNALGQIKMELADTTHVGIMKQYSTIASVVATDNNGIIIDNTLSQIKMELADTTHAGIMKQYSTVAPAVATDNNGILIDNTLSQINLELADSTHNGIVSTTTQSIAGFKTFITGLTSPDSNISQNTFFGTGTGNTNTNIQNTGFGYQVLSSISNSVNGNHTGIGFRALNAMTTGINCTAVGKQAMVVASTTNNSTAIGVDSMLAVTGGSASVAIGYNSLPKSTAPSSVVAIGTSALSNITGTASSIIAIGAAAGSAYTTTESGNICIGNNGVVAESNVTRIGTSQTKCFIKGISGITTGGSAVTALVDGNGQLGTVSSERELKENIKPLDDVRDIIKQLNPCSFNMISDESKTKTIGFIADEFEKVMPEFVVTQENGVRTIQYHLLSTLYLKEIQRLQNVVESLQTQIYEINYKLQAR